MYNSDIFFYLFICVQVYEVTIFEAEDNDSFDEDTEITEAVSLNTQTNIITHMLYTSGLNCVCVCFSLSGLLAVFEV